MNIGRCNSGVNFSGFNPGGPGAPTPSPGNLELDILKDRFMESLLLNILGATLGPGPANGGFHNPSTMSEEMIRQNPNLLSGKGVQGLDIEGMDLQTSQNGTLTEESKRKVNELIGYLSDKLGVEVAAQAYQTDDGSLKVHLTAGTPTSVTHLPPENTIYSAHTHPNGSPNPSQADYLAQIPGAEDAVVPSDGIAGNEDDSYYNIFA